MTRSDRAAAGKPENSATSAKSETTHLAKTKAGNTKPGNTKPGKTKAGKTGAAERRWVRLKLPAALYDALAARRETVAAAALPTVAAAPAGAPAPLMPIAVAGALRPCPVCGRTDRLTLLLQAAAPPRIACVGCDAEQAAQAWNVDVDRLWALIPAAVPPGGAPAEAAPGDVAPRDVGPEGVGPEEVATGPAADDTVAWHSDYYRETWHVRAGFRLLIPFGTDYASHDLAAGRALLDQLEDWARVNGGFRPDERKVVAIICELFSQDDYHGNRHDTAAEALAALRQVASERQVGRATASGVTASGVTERESPA